MVLFDCIDFFGGVFDLLFVVEVNGSGYSYYLENLGCYNMLLDMVFQLFYVCFIDILIMVEVCLLVIENDVFFQFLLGCDIEEICIEIICVDFVVLLLGSMVGYVLFIDVLGFLSGEVNFILEILGVLFFDNDLICNVVDLGMLIYGDMLGDMIFGIYFNVCVMNIGELDLQGLGYYFMNE